MPRHPIYSVWNKKFSTKSSDSVSPSCTLLSYASNPVTCAYDVLVIFSESVIGFSAGDITVVNGTATLSGSGSSYTATINPDWTGTVTVTVNAGVCTDLAGNPNTASNTITRTIPTYDNISDDFSADTGWLDGNIAVAAITVSSNKGIWTPTYGPEKHVGPNAASDPNANEANNVTGWSVTNATIVSENTDVNTGSYALQVDGTGAVARAISSYAVSLGQWLLWTLAAKQGTAGVSVSTQNAIPAVAVTPAVSWTNYAIASSATTTSWQAWLYPSAALKTVYADNISIKEITAASLYRLKTINYPCSVSVKTWQGINVFAGLGIVLFRDTSNYILAYQNYTSIRRLFLLKSVSGTVSEASPNVSYSYGAGNTLSLTPNADFNQFSVVYNGITAFNNISITDFDYAGGPWYTGLFLTYNTGNLTTAAFGTFAATRVAGSPPFCLTDPIDTEVGERI